MQKLTYYLSQKNAELVFINEKFIQIKVNGYLDHSKAATMAAELEYYHEDASKKAILFEVTQPGNDCDDFTMALLNNTGNGVPECLCSNFGGSRLNRWWYGYINGSGNFWSGLKTDTETQKIFDVAKVSEYLKKFWD